VICDALTCDRESDDIKESCDRSCIVDIEQLAQKMKRSLGVVDAQDSVLLHQKNITDSESAISGGPFVVKDSGLGPLIITAEHGLLIVQHTDDAQICKCASLHSIVMLTFILIAKL